MKFKIYVKDSDPVYGGWFDMDEVTAETEAEALAIAKEIYGEQTKVKKVV